MPDQFKPPKPPERKADVIVGDEVYFHHGNVPKAGKVCSHGVHGCTVDADGAKHKVRWDRVLGHKKRAGQQYKIADEGEDGMIVQDARGLRQFIAMPPEAREEQMMVKSEGGTRRVALLLKSGMAPRPGLTEKVITDKNGVQTKRWVSATPDMPHPQVGHHVGFVNGEHRGHGRIASVGNDGVMVNDKAGGLHRVRHEHVTHRWDSDQAPDRDPHDAGAEAQAAKKAAESSPEHVAQNLLNPDEVAALPARAVQPHKTWEDLQKHAPAALEEFNGLLGQVAKAMNLRSDRKPKDLTPEDWNSDEGHLFVAGLKGAERAKEKVEADYGGDWSKLNDVVRGTIAVASLDQVKQAIEHVKAAGLEFAQKPKNRFASPTEVGYRDMMAIVKLPSGMMAELQFSTKPMSQAKRDGHKPYEVYRGLQAKHNSYEPDDSWPDEDHTAFYEAVKQQKQIYGDAWNRMTSGGDATHAAEAGEFVKAGGAKPLQKAIIPLIILMKKGASDGLDRE